MIWVDCPLRFHVIYWPGSLLLSCLWVGSTIYMFSQWIYIRICLISHIVHHFQRLSCLSIESCDAEVQEILLRFGSCFCSELLWIVYEHQKVPTTCSLTWIQLSARGKHYVNKLNKMWWSLDHSCQHRPFLFGQYTCWLNFKDIFSNSYIHKIPFGHFQRHCRFSVFSSCTQLH